MADILNYMMLLLNMLVVVLIVYKTIKFPAAADEEAAVAANATEAAEAEATTFEHDVLALSMVVLPIISGVLLTINNAFAPIAKFNALRWATQRCESEIYAYRARAVAYAATVVSASWAFEKDDDDDDGTQQDNSKKFVESLQSISTSVRSESQLQSSSMSFFKDDQREKLIKRRIAQLRDLQCQTETDEIITSAMLETARTGADNSDGKPTQEQEEFYKENECRIGEALMMQVEDDGFAVLQADEYLAVRASGCVSSCARLRWDLMPAGAHEAGAGAGHRSAPAAVEAKGAPRERNTVPPAALGAEASDPPPLIADSKRFSTSPPASRCCSAR